MDDNNGCVWHEDESGIWTCLTCQLMWEFTEGGPGDNEVNYCPKCGRVISDFEPYEEVE